MASYSDHVLLKTKISPPTIKQNLLIRERLIKSMTEGMYGRLTTVCAPAGFGKTTLITQWLHQNGLRTAWISLDDTDNDLIRFWRYITQSLIAACPTQLTERLSQLVPLLPSLTVNTFIDAMINELCALTEPLVFVLDDYHKINQQRIHDSLSYFIDYVPEHIHIIIASRNEIPFSTSKWTARGERNSINIVQLQFTMEETQSFYHKVAPLPLTDHHIEKLFQQTEGWITGLQLVSISLRSSSNFDQYIHDFNGYHRNIAEYLFEEVLTQLPSQLNSFLLQTSVLERMDTAVCNAVTRSTDSVEILEKLQALNLFVIPLDDHNTWFRYHHLFSDFLRNTVKRSYPARWLESNQAASEHFASRGLTDKAIDHAILGEDFLNAAALLDQCATDMLNRGELSTLVQWFEAIAPHTELSSNLSLLHAFMLVVTGQTDRASKLLDRIEQYSLTIENTEERTQIHSGMLFIKSNLVFYSGNYEQWYEYAEGRLGGILPESPLFYNFNYNMTEPFVRRTAFGLKGVLTTDTETIALRFTSILESHGWKHSLINLYVIQSLCEGYYEWNRLDECLRLAHKVGQSDRFEQIPGLSVPNRITQARVHMAHGNFRLAHDMIDEAIQSVSKRNDYYWLNPLRAFRVRLYLLEGQLTQAKKEIAGLQLSTKDRPSSNRMFEYITLARLLSARNKDSDALRLLEQLKLQSTKEQCLLSMAEISSLQALIELQRGQRSDALRYLHGALAIGEPNGYIRTFLDEGKAMFKLLQAYIHQRERDAQHGEQQEVSLAYVQRLLSLFPQNTQNQERKTVSLTEPLNQQEQFILKLLKQGASNRQISETAALTEGTVKVYLSRIYAKLGVSSRTQALIAAQELQLFNGD
jgi:LuxR family maltose regulon positive regulatory protein